MSIARWSGIGLLALAACSGAARAAGSPLAEDPNRMEAYRLVDRAKAAFAGDIRGQAARLAELAWPNEAADPWVTSLAREQLTHYGADALPVLRQAIHTADPRYHVDIVACLIETKDNISGSLPSDYLPAIEDAIWFGSLEAKRMAIPEAARYRFPMALLTIMDAAHEHPSLTPIAIQALGDFRNERARIFLAEVLRSGLPRERTLAARALGKIGGNAMDTLREAARDDDLGCRTAALETLLPVTGTADLSLLHEYIGLHADDNPALYELAVQRALLLEAIQERQLEAESASAN